MTEALAALREIPGEPALRALPVLPDEPPFSPHTSFETELAHLVLRPAERFVHPLRRALPDVDDVVTSVVEALRGLNPAVPTLIHGDLIAANVLAADGHASAVLDFGFLTTTGDPLFDVTITASIFDMYGPGARETERALDRAFGSAFPSDPRRSAIYRASYALTTACCYGTDLSEGHFAWCVSMLSRPELRGVLAG